jgi:hypothetical protein
VPKTYHRKGQHPFERALFEFLDALKTIPPPHASQVPTAPAFRGVMTPENLGRVLNHLAQRQARYAYSWVLAIWFQEHGIIFPDGFFQADPFAPGSGGKTAESTRELGGKAWFEQVMAKVGGPAALEAELRDPNTRAAAQKRHDVAFQEVLAQKSTLSAAELAEKLIPEEYKRNKRAARKRVETALKRVLPNIQNMVDAVWLATEPEFLVKLFLKGWL